jgi:hypothetical protein
MKDALLGDDGADQEGDQGDDRNGLPADLIKMIDQRLEPERSRPSQDAETGRTQAPSICRKTDTSSAALNVDRPTFQSRKNGF